MHIDYAYVCHTYMDFFFFPFFSCTCGICKFPGKESNLSCICGPDHSCILRSAFSV